MITITMKTSSPKAIELAKKMQANLEEMKRETRENAKTPEYQAILAKLRGENEKR